MVVDYCIIGLGNPGAKYFNTRHNIGFIVIDRLAEFFRIESFILENNYLYATALYNDKKIVLLKPVTYMNLSGRAVKEFYNQHEILPENTLIIYDDVNLDFGVLRMRPSGSDGGQNGIKSVIYEMETEEIPRLRVGIKNETDLEKVKTDEGYDLAEFVLSEFNSDEAQNVEAVTGAALKAVLSFINDGIDAAMNLHNKKAAGENNTN